MKIIIFAAFFYPFKGGYAESVFALSKGLAKEGHQVTIVTTNTHHSPRKQKLEGINKINIIRLPCWNWRFLNNSFPIIKPFATIKLFYHLSKQKYDVVSTQTRFFTTSFLGFLFAKFKRIKLIHTERGSCHTKTLSRIISLINQLVDHTLGFLIMKFSDRVVGVSEACCQFAKHLGAKNPIKIYNGVDMILFSGRKTNLRNKLGLNHKQIIITFVGRLISAKGIQDLITVFGRLNCKFPNIYLLIVGDGPYLEELKKQVQKLNLKEKVKFLGEKDKKEIAKILSITDTFVNPSYSEGLPTSVLEAGAAGRAIVATNVGGTKEIIKNPKMGLLISHQSLEELEQSLDQLIRNKNLRKELGENLKEFVKKEFDWEKITNQYINLYKKYV